MRWKVVVFVDAECVEYVHAPFRAREFALCLSVAQAAQRPRFDRHANARREMPRDFPRLIEAALAQAAGMQGHGDNASG